MKRFLFYCPCEGAVCTAPLKELSGSASVDIWLHDWTGKAEFPVPEDYEWEAKTSMKGHKWPAIHEFNQRALFDGYEAVAFWDDDLVASARDIELLFHLGTMTGLDLWQASLTKDSETAWPKLISQYRNEYPHLRKTDFVEIMMPVFSQRGLRACSATFGMSETGWGLGKLWPKELKRVIGEARMAVVDMVQVGHPDPIVSTKWRTSGGLSPFQEMDVVAKRYKKFLRKAGCTSR